MPRVTVLMPVYNASRYLDASLRSVLTQDYDNFEVVIVNDFSTDRSAELVQSFSDRRIRLINNKRNLGVAASLNKGLATAEGTYILRMDADDISLPGRIRKQVEFMEANPEVGISGTWVETIGEQAGYHWKYETNPKKIPSVLFFYCCLAHPSVIMRKALLDFHGLKYSEVHPHAEDWELWIRSSFCFPIANLPEILLQYRINLSSVTRNNSTVQDKTIAGIHNENLGRLGIRPEHGQLDLHRAICACNYQNGADFFANAYMWLQRVMNANRSVHLFKEKEFEEVISEKLIDISLYRTALRFRMWSSLARFAIRRIKLGRVNKRKRLL